MHERERHDVILATVQESPVATVQRLVELTQSSEATIRRDIAALHLQKRVRRVRGGAVALAAAPFHVMAGRPFSDRMMINMEQKQAIAERAVALCTDNEPIIINGGTTTFQMVPFLRDRRLQIFTNSFPIAEALLKQSQNTVMMPGGTIYREINIILSPFENDVSRNFSARRMFIGGQGVSHLGLMETDPLLIQAEQKLLGQADELVVLVDSTKFSVRSSLIVCGLDQVSTLITDTGISDDTRTMLLDAGVRLITVETTARDVAGRVSGVAQ
ncbi:DeoR/GlpR family DNA-binding transcription regulator [Bauldia litoralis]|uniref:Transcriptional regulator, DeoR family n=1 Tax=Bauldia litoralis TaxID=665467 RepID=A0A1G6A732_9HYPH|nr:DeoR/GlpR family DNA-binding transcription regulator [Bauldia litoralis]SDB04257.1 transcriptional regulator, DeoR family [Bauldia litoralis]